MHACQGLSLHYSHTELPLPSIFCFHLSAYLLTPSVYQFNPLILTSLALEPHQRNLDFRIN